MQIDFDSKIGSVKESNETFYLQIKGSINRTFSIPIKTSKIPSNGLFLGEKIVESKLDIVDCLEIGAGQYAPASFCLLASDSKSNIDLVEVDNGDYEKLYELIDSNAIDERSKCYCGNLFSPIPIGKKYDLIFSNIAQMPLEQGKPSKTHDHGGVDGWEYLNEIIKQAPNYLRPNGHLALMIFDFLGIEKRNNIKIKSAKERLMDAGFEIIKTLPYLKTIRHGGETEKALEYIFKIYPNAVLYRKDLSTISYDEYLRSDEKNYFVAFQFVLAKLNS